jgi:hypothetical protein
MSTRPSYSNSNRNMSRLAVSEAGERGPRVQSDGAGIGGRTAGSAVTP